MISTLGGMLGCQEKTEAYAATLRARLEAVEQRTRRYARRPRVYFEEWDEPQISGIRWVSELIRISGGDDCFPELGAKPLARDRIIVDPMTVVDRAPDIIIGSWCGKKFRPERVRERPGWEGIPAVRDSQVFEIKSPLILQPGPAALTDGLDALEQITTRWQDR